MNAQQNSHPDRETLNSFGSGKLQPADAAIVEAHIAECDECCETLSGLASDTFFDLVRESDAMEVESFADDGTVGLNELQNETDYALPVELSNHSRYRVLELLGKGGMGNVYKAEHTLMNRAVALKVINQELVQNDQAVKRFRREVQSAAQLTHPNIVTAHDAEQAGDMHLLVMEYVQGDTLSDVVKRDRTLDISLACDYIRQAAEGLQHAHEKGMVHRDVKPHNLMVTPDRLVKILDFGLATLVSETMAADAADQQVEHSINGTSRPQLTSAGSMMGTPDFIAPEQATDARVADIRSDIYSLGCTFYYVLTRRPPFTEGSALERTKAHGELEPEPIENLRPDIPTDLAEIVRRMMAKDPLDRFQTPAAVAEAIAPFVDAPRLMSERQGITDLQLRKASPRRFWQSPVIITALALAAFVLAGVIYVATDNGTLVVDSVDDNVEVTILTANGLRLVDTATGSTVKRLPSGEYSVDLKGDGNEFELSQERLLLKRGGRVIVKVTRSKKTDHAGQTKMSGAGAVEKTPTLRRIWDKALDILGAPSADGRYLSFVDWETGDLAIHDLVNDTNQRLTNKGSWNDNPIEFAEFSVFSPNGEWLAYSWFNKEKRYELRTVTTSGGPSRIIFPGDQIRYIWPMQWSPDGARVLACVTNKDETNDLVLVNAETNEVSVVKSDRSPRRANFSPDGKFIAYGRHDIFLLALSDSDGEAQETQLVDHPSDDSLLGWSPNGEGILFASDRRGSWDAWLLKMDEGKPNGDPILVQQNIPREWPMGFASDGAFFFAENAGSRDVYTAQFDTLTGNATAPQIINQQPVGGNEIPAWSPDGQQLAYFSERRKSLTVYSVETGQARVLSPRFDYIRPWHLRWSPKQDALLVFGRTGSKGTGIFRIGVDSGQTDLLVAGGGSDWTPAGDWSADGKSVYWLRADEGIIFRRNLASARDENVLKLREKSNRVRFAVSPDGKHIGFTDFEDGSCVLKVVQLASGSTKQLDRAGRRITELQWSADSKALVYAAKADKGSQFFRIAVDGNSDRQTLQVPMKGVNHVSVHPDRRRIAFSAGDNDWEIWSLENFLPPLKDDEPSLNSRTKK